MEEEKKEVVEETPVEEAPAEEAAAEQAEPLPEEALKKNALIAFILCCAGVVFLWSGIVPLVCGIVAKIFLKKNGGALPEDQAHNIFAKVSKIVSIIIIIIGAVLCAAALIGGIISLGIAIVGAIISAVTNVVLL